MLYDTYLRSQLAREHADRLAHEMRRVRVTPDQVGYPGWARRAAELLGRAERLRRRGGQTPAYEA